MVADPAVGGGDDHGSALARPAHVADEALVEDGVDGGPVVPAPLGQTSDLGPGGRGFGAGGRFRAVFGHRSAHLPPRLLQYEM